MSKGKDRTRIYLMDDRKENCDAVQKSSFKAIHVKPDGRGIRRKDVKSFIDSVNTQK